MAHFPFIIVLAFSLRLRAAEALSTIDASPGTLLSVELVDEIFKAKNDLTVLPRQDNEPVGEKKDGRTAG